MHHQRVDRENGENSAVQTPSATNVTKSTMAEMPFDVPLSTMPTV
jgi:hypothetical protein